MSHNEEHDLESALVEGDPLDFWHRRLSPASEWLVLSGDLHHLRPRAERQIAAWRDAGITAVIDCRAEWSDAELVAEVAPEVRYHHVGTHDDGDRKGAAWFEEGLDAWREAAAVPGARVLVHCHMGINRGPSMGYRLLLEAGCDPVEALATIRRVRPIAAVGYARDALDHWHATTRAAPDLRRRQARAVDDWMRANGIDLDSLLRRMREPNA